ncbi:MAG: DEAD/DEAH box helicase [Thermoanaerobaculia bacterium]
MSLNPIQFGRDVLDQYGRYLLTTFRLSDPRLAGQLRSGLAYGPGTGDRLARGPYIYLNRPFVQGPSFRDLLAEKELGLHPALPGLFPFKGLYKHQERSLRAAMSGRHVLLATGTGSGKTEGFLLPILDHCLKLRDAEAEPGVVAVLIYPMNALVNDQVERLRRMLAGTGITFGRYTGETPDTDAATERLPERRGYTQKELDQAEKLHGDLPLPWEECASRKEILERRPRLLLTNYAQLEYLLLRDKDLSLFQAAPLRFFVLDEVHTYTGALGSQVACLLRRLRSVARKELGEVVCIGSSATVTERETRDADVQLRSFGGRLFGVPDESIQVVQEEFQRQRPVGGERYVPPPPDEPAALLAKILDAVRDLLVAEEVHDLPEEVLRLAERLCGRPAPAGRGSLERLWDLLAPNRLVETLQESFTRPVTLEEALPRLQPLGDRKGRSVPELQAEVLAYLTLGALARRDDEPLLRPKLHFFVQGLSGLWVQWLGHGPEPEPRLLFSDRGNGDELPLPLSFCRACGQPFVHLHPAEAEAVEGGGKVNGFQKCAGLGPAPPEGAGEDDRGILLADRLIRGDEEEEDAGETRYLCRWCGGLHEGPSPACLGATCKRSGPLVKVQTWKQPISSCPACGARSSERSPIVTLVRSTEVNDVMIVAQTMLSSMPEPDLRKVLIFADSRQDAAFQAGWMDGRSLRFRVRHMAYSVLEGDPARRWYFKDLVEEVANLATAGGIVHPKGQRRDADLDRLSWLLIEELFAASERQRRNSLEQLGLARVDYDGVTLAEMEPLARAWAAELAVTPQQIVNTVEALLDLFRLKHAVSHPMLRRLWSDRDREVREGIVTTQEHYRPRLVVQRAAKTQKTFTIALHSKTRMTAAERLVAAAFERGPGKLGEKIDRFLDDVFAWLVEKQLLVPERIKVLRHGKLQDMAKISAGYQVNVDLVQIRHTTERFVCRHCGKAAGRALPSGRCRGYLCEGKVALEPRDAEHFDVVQYTQREFVPLLSREHSAQVPKEDRLEAEREFKKTNGRANCLVATPTLELGVDIGPLEMVLLRNVPPSPANYAQRSGRAGRRHRIGAVFCYCRNAQHDQYFYGQPPAMIAGEVRVPGFSMRNEPLVRQHVFSAILTELRGWEGAKEALAKTFPTYIWNYFGTKAEDGSEHYRSETPDFSEFRSLLASGADKLLATLRATFSQWPEEDAEIVSEEALRRRIAEMPAELDRVAATLLAEVRSYQRILRELRDRQDQGENLAFEDTMRRNSYEAALRRLWREDQENYSISYLARRGFFPGYALVKDHVRAQSVEPPLDLGRPLVVALRELAPASLIYANRRQFRMTGLEIYRLKAQDPHFRPESLEKRMVFEPALARVVEPGRATEGGQKPAVGFSSIQMIDVALEGLGRISDQEEYRHRRAYYQYALQLPEHRGGHRGRVGLVPYSYLREGNLRTVNLGTKKTGPATPEDGIGFPICLVCGEVRSPLASPIEIKDFVEHHKKRCRRAPGWHALHVDVRSDLLILGPFTHEHGAVNAVEALRIGFRRVLEMGETELETELLVDDQGKAQGVLFDPLPGGSGFLPLAMEHWERVVDSAKEVLAACTCEKACYRCLLHFRNQQHHGVLDRNVALAALSDALGPFGKEHEIAPTYVREKSHSDKTESPKEDRFLAILKARSFPLPPEAQFPLELGGGSRTVADFAYPEQKVLLYVDGLSTRIHGNEEQRRKDRILRTKAELKGWKVRTISGEGLADETMLADFLDDLAVLLGLDYAN